MTKDVTQVIKAGMGSIKQPKILTSEWVYLFLQYTPEISGYAIFLTSCFWLLLVSNSSHISWLAWSGWFFCTSTTWVASWQMKWRVTVILSSKAWFPRRLLIPFKTKRILVISDWSLHRGWVKLFRLSLSLLICMKKESRALILLPYPRPHWVRDTYFSESVAFKLVPVVLLEMMHFSLCR